MAVEEDARFDALLEECCARVREGERLESCLADYPAEYQGELARLVPLADRVAQLRRDPSPDFQSALEQRLLAAVDRERAGRQVGLLRRIGRFITARPAMRLVTVLVVMLIVVVGGGVGAIQAADGSLPDSPLYQVKTAREWAELVLARTGESKVGVQARQIAARGRELEWAVQTGRPRIVEALCASLATSSERIVDQALVLRRRGNAQPAVRALMSVRLMQRHVDRLAAQASAELRAPLQRLEDVLREQERRLAERNAIT